VIGHAVLHSDAATERCDTVDGLVGNRLGVIEEPVQACERYLLVDSLEDVERPAYRLVIGGVKTPGPAILGEDADDRIELALHLRGHIRPRLAEIFKVRG
jgi:hypothetical protein